MREAFFDFLYKAASLVHEILRYGLIEISEHTVKVSNVILAAFLTYLGLKYYKKFSLWVDSFVNSKLKMEDKSLNHIVEKLIVYSSISLYVILVMEVLNVPIKAFAFIGGSVALACGLGSQAMVANLVSSLVIMAEGAFKIGDSVEIEGVSGTVVTIGSRCTVLLTNTGARVLVPNSKFMSNNLINKTPERLGIRLRAEVRIQKNSEKTPDYKIVVEELSAILKKLEFLNNKRDPKVEISGVERHSLAFSLDFYCDESKSGSLSKIKDVLNAAFIERLNGYDFGVTYLN